MKYLLPNAGGAFLVVRFPKNTQEGADRLRDELLAVGDWGDSDESEYSDYLSAAEAIGGVILNKEYVCIEDLSDDQRMLIRGAVQGEWQLTKEVADAAPEEPTGSQEDMPTEE